ncbi:pre-rRNA-processing protein TSR2 [Aphis craccivora]|uniref:Pre-rRNA-processing protein TSR2 n=1 Tax=Aphis craccivora TaxID=307492 RepID=A0A6G0YE55_APHCR|nr:pre-rRNA-processing protein TSR2 [Aphis craccivora]
MSMMTSRTQMELEENKFKWNVGVNFLNIISVLFNNWREMRSVVDGLPEVQRKTLNNDIRKLIKNVFDCILIYGKDCNNKLMDQIIKSMNDDFHLIIEDFSAKEISTYILYMYAKWFYAEDFTENRLQVIAEIKNFSKPDPIVEFEVIFSICFTIYVLQLNLDNSNLFKSTF